MYPTQNVIDSPHCRFNELWMMDRKESPSIVIITEKGNNERHFPPAFFPFFFSKFDNSRVIVRPSAGGAAVAAYGAADGDTAAQHIGEMARVSARWYGTYLSVSRSAATTARRRDCGGDCDGDCGGGLLWTLRFWGISASLHNWTIVSCTFLWDPQSVKTTDYGCLIKFFLSNVLADCTQKLWIWSLISFKLWTS